MVVSVYVGEGIRPEDKDAAWVRDLKRVRDWAARNGLVTIMSHDEDIEDYDPDWYCIHADPKPDSDGITFVRPVVGGLYRRYSPLLSRWFHEVRLVRHGKNWPSPVTVSVDELERCGVEIRHLDRID